MGWQECCAAAKESSEAVELPPLRDNYHQLSPGEGVLHEGLQFGAQKRVKVYRGAGRKDANQKPIEEALASVGASFIDTSILGGGMPDLIVGWRGVTVLMEVKIQQIPTGGAD